jgi:hypothetical protein
MPSDPRTDQALKAFHGRLEAFQASLGATVDQIDHYLADHHEAGNGGHERVASELGPFGAGRIDVRRFSQLFRAATLDGRVRETIQRARETLAELTGRGLALYTVDVPSGRDLVETVGESLAQIGRAFGAARVFDLARSGIDHDQRHPLALGSFPFERWTRRERELTPPLVVSVDGADLTAGGLARYLDGAAQFVLLVRGTAPPAPLARLITPGVLVLQTHDGTGLEHQAGWEGTAISAWLPETAARFVHDPGRGDTPASRIVVDQFADPPGKAVGGSSVFQQTEELAQLKWLATSTGTVEPAEATPSTRDPQIGTAAPDDPAAKLAAWLLNQADLQDVS